jgi:hypothetical protein
MIRLPRNDDAPPIRISYGALGSLARSREDRGGAVSALRVSAAPREPGSVGQLEPPRPQGHLEFTHSIGRRASF